MAGKKVQSGLQLRTHGIRNSGSVCDPDSMLSCGPSAMSCEYGNGKSDLGVNPERVPVQ